MALAVLLTVAAVVLVAFVGKGSIIDRAEVTAAALAGLIFLFLAYALYTGGRIRKQDRPPVKVEGRLGLGDVAQAADPSWLPDVGFDAGDDAGCLGVVIGILVSVVVAVAIVVLVWLLASLVIPGLLLVLLGLWWVTRLALRQAFSKSRICRGNLANSLRYALLYTLLYTGWLFLVLAGARWWVERGAGPG